MKNNFKRHVISIGYFLDRVITEEPQPHAINFRISKCLIYLRIRRNFTFVSVTASFSSVHKVQIRNLEILTVVLCPSDCVCVSCWNAVYTKCMQSAHSRTSCSPVRVFNLRK